MAQTSYRIAARENREKLAQGLGWFSIGLGLLEIFAPRALSRLIGVRPRTGMMQLLGAREVVTGIGILTQPQTDKWIKARVAGDTLDLTLLGAGFMSDESEPGRLALATVAVAGVTALDVLCATDLTVGPGTQSQYENGAGPGAVHVRRSVIINERPENLYQRWHDFETLPQFMSHLISVENTGEKRSHWVAKGPAGSRVEWDAEVSEDVPNQLIAWRSLPGADVDNAGSVRFQPATGGRGTIVRVDMHYRPPAGKAGAWIAKMLGQSPEKQLAVDLVRFKQMVETGEIARTEGQPAGRLRSTSRKYDDLVRA
jgi:uncharacterized membrane protein